jgi:hypothetical protein
VVPLHPVLVSDGPTDPEEGDAANAGLTAASSRPLPASAASTALLMPRLALIFISTLTRVPHARISFRGCWVMSFYPVGRPVKRASQPFCVVVWAAGKGLREMADQTHAPGPLEPEKRGATAEPGHPQPEAAEVESARLLANQAREVLEAEGYDETRIRRLADEYVALDRGTSLDGFVDWVRSGPRG